MSIIRRAVWIAAVLWLAVSVAAMAHAAHDDLVTDMAIPRLVDGAWMMPQPHHARGAVEDYAAQIAEACAYWGCSPSYLESVMACESGGDPGAVAYNPSSGNYTYGIFQIDAMWGGAGMSSTQQIWFAAEHLTKGDVWWACG